MLAPVSLLRDQTPTRCYTDRQSGIMSVYSALHVPAFRPTRAGLWVLHAASNIQTLL
jgi:hypothetical protein